MVRTCVGAAAASILCRVGRESNERFYRSETVVRSLHAVLFASLVAGFSVGSCGAADTPAGAPLPAGDTPDAAVNSLIEQLGDRSFAQRQRAADELRRLGLLAFDALHAAQYHPDSEIAMAARYLIDSIQVSWDQPGDSESVREILKNYGTLRTEKRTSRMNRLAQLPEREGLEALCRLARYEVDLRMRREAAVLIMLQPQSAGDTERRVAAETIRRSIDQRSQVPSNWLRIYAADLAAQQCSADAWREEIEAEIDRIAERTTHRTDASVAVRLARSAALRALSAGEKEQAIDFVRRTHDLIPARRQELLAAVEWSDRNKLWQSTIELAGLHPALLDQHPLLAYAVAAAHESIGQTEQAEEIAAAALATDPVEPLNAEAEGAGLDELREERIRAHLQTATLLQQQGRYRWAEAEYRAVIAAAPLDTITASYAIAELSMMLMDQQRYADAAEVIEPLSKRLNADEEFQRTIDRRVASQSADLFTSRLLYSKALAALEAEQDAEARQLLRDAVALEPLNSDILIAMYRTDGDGDWQEEVRREIQRAEQIFLARIKQLENARGRLSDPAAIDERSRQLANYCNDYAWLIANTEGDQKAALQRSLQSIELAPNTPSYLDTLGRCYWAVGNRKLAIEYQQQAVQLEPHSLPMQRQLEFFTQNEPGDD